MVKSRFMHDHVISHGQRQTLLRGNPAPTSRENVRSAPTFTITLDNLIV